MNTVALREVVSVSGGGTPRKSVPQYYGGEIPWVTPKDMKRPVIGESEITLTAEGVKNSPAKLVPEGSVLVVVRSGVLKHTLPVALTSRPVTVNQDMKALVPVAGLDAGYLARLLKALQPRVLTWVRATTADNFPIDSLLDLEVVLPPFGEQRRIAAILEQADALRAKRRRVLAQLDALTQSIYFDMFEGRNWPTLPVVELAARPDDVKCGPFGTQLQQSEFRSKGIPLLGIKNVNAKFELPPFEFLEQATAQRLDTYSVQPGDIVMTRKGTIGNCAVYPHDATPGVMHSDLLRLRVASNRTDAVYLEHHLQMSPRVGHQIAMMSPGALMPGINVTKLKQLVVDAPPLELQRRFAQRMHAVSVQRAAVRVAQSVDDEVFASLQSRAFRGDL